ncbi:MAG: putative MPP superfamily phosphohydrolase [Chlamydiales bacterium]
MVLFHQNKPEVAGVAPRRHSDARLAFFRAAERLFVWAGGRRFYRHFFLRAGRFVVREERVYVPDLPPELDGFSIAQLSDFHAGPFLGAGDLDDVIAAVEALDVDLVAMTGDFITHHSREVECVLHDLGRFRSRLGSFAVLGNHDYHRRQEARIVTGLAQQGVRCLRNESVRLDVGTAQLYVVGLEDLEESRDVDPERARADVPAGGLEILLCHNPMGAPRLYREGCIAILSGHTHGTQIDLPVLRRMGPQHPGLRVDFGPTTLLVSRGIGVVGAPLRFRAPAEIVCVRLVRGAAQEVVDGNSDVAVAPGLVD